MRSKAPYLAFWLGLACVGCGAFLGNLDATVGPDGSPGGGADGGGGPPIDSCTDGWRGDLSSDPTHCGACASRCRGGEPGEAREVCSLGACQEGCATGLADCGRACVNLDRSPTNCGACGKACGPDQTCSAGACVSLSSITNACTRYAEAFIGAPIRCNLFLVPKYSVNAYDLGHVAHRRERLAASCVAMLTSPSPGLVMTPSTIDSCAGVLESAPCNANVDWFTGAGIEALCTIPKGTQPEAAPCVTSAQCASGSCSSAHAFFPIDIEPGALGCGGTCVTKSGDCQGNDLLCPPDTECREGACNRRGIVDVDGVCASNASCKPGLRCVLPTGGGPTRCEKGGPGTLGAECSAPWDCVAPAACYGGKCTTPVGAGGTCTPAVPCAPGLACNRRLSEQSSICTRIEYGAPGDHCNGAVTACEVGACEGASENFVGRCPAFGPDGATCYRQSPCDELASCIGGRCSLTGPLVCPNQ